MTIADIGIREEGYNGKFLQVCYAGSDQFVVPGDASNMTATQEATKHKNTKVRFLAMFHLQSLERSIPQKSISCCVRQGAGHLDEGETV